MILGSRRRSLSDFNALIVVKLVIKLVLSLFCTKIYEYSIKIFMKGAVELLEEPQK